MSAPEPDYDQLLSDHLDGRLVEADAQMLEQSMRENPALHSQFDAMLGDRQDLRNLFAVEQAISPSLKSDFASRVLTESRRRGLQTRGERNSQENIATTQSHSVERREEPVSAPNRHRISLVVGLIATAAAVLLVVSLSFRGGQSGDDDRTVAQNQPARSADADRGDSPKSHAVSPSIEVASSLTETPTDAVLAASEPMIASADQTEKSSEAQPRELDRDFNAAQPLPSDVAAMSDPAAPMDRSATVSLGDDASQRNSSLFQVAMLVYEVRLSPQGRRDDVLGETMRRVGLQDARRLPINRDVIAAAKRADTFDEEAKFQILFLQASAKKIDRLFLTLQQDSQSVEAVRHSLITDAPLMQLANDLTRVDATKIRHDASLSFELTNNDSDELATLRELLGDQAFGPITPNGKVPQPESLSDTGNDVIMQVLILVR